MKAAVITLALSDNYGAALQTCGLAWALKKLGIESETYKYQNWSRITYGMSTFSRIKYEGQKVVKQLLTQGMRQKRFDTFRTKYIPMTSHLYRNNEELRQTPGDYDVYISGSDQIWNPKLFVFDYSYFLDFVPEEAKRISYASSFGKTSFESAYREKCGQLLGRYSHISVREKSGEAIVADLCGKKAQTCLDPTLLLTKQDWEPMMADASEQAKSFKGILCYIMPGDKVVENAIESLARQLQHKTGFPIMRLGIKEYNLFRYPVGQTDVKAGPAEFLAYFAGAKYVVTNSFHGTAFGMNFGKECYIPVNYSLQREAALHERILSLLELTQAQEFIVSAENPVLLKNRCIDHERITTCLARLREESFEYLKQALEITQ